MPTGQYVLAFCFVILAASGCKPTKRQPHRQTAHRTSAQAETASVKMAITRAIDQEQKSGALTNSSFSGEIETSPNAIRILSWNIESGGADINVIGSQLEELPRYDVYGFTEVDRDEWPVIKQTLGNGYTFWCSYSGFRDRTAFAFDNTRFDLIKKYEMTEYQGAIFNPGKYRSPHVHELYDKKNNIEITLLLNHLARRDATIRQEQAKGLRLWAATKDEPVVAIGDYNFDYVFAIAKGNPSFDLFMEDNVFKWVKPQPLLDSNWFDGDGDGQDDYPGSILDFCFVAGAAKSWDANSRVIVRAGDFPDDEKTSDHRPLELILTP